MELLASICRRLPATRGKSGLAWRLMRRSELRGSLAGTWRFRLADGTRLELPRQSRMTWAAAFSGRYDHAAVQQIAGYIRPGTVVLDVGASIGLWTVQLARLAASRGAELWAFEPNPANTAWIRRNVALNGLSGTVTVCEHGLGDRTESSILVGSEYGVGNGAIALRNGESTDKHPRISVAVRRLDEIELPLPVSFMKIDVEGYEPAVLRGAATLIERDRPVIFGEFGSGWLQRRGEDARTALEALDYDVMTLAPARQSWRGVELSSPRHVDLAGQEQLPQNLLLCPRGARHP
jgi:FkbM family methyltransferase